MKPVAMTKSFSVSLTLAVTLMAPIVSCAETINATKLADLERTIVWGLVAANPLRYARWYAHSLHGSADHGYSPISGSL